MRKRSETIVVSIAVLGTLICVCLGGCGDKKGDAFAEEERTTYIYGDSIQEGDDGALLSVRLGVPGACNVEFDTGKSKLRDIRLSTENIVVPDTDAAYVVDFDNLKIEAEEIQKMVDIPERLISRADSIINTIHSAPDRYREQILELRDQIMEVATTVYKHKLFLRQYFKLPEKQRKGLFKQTK